MQVSCPSCTAQYRFEASKIPKEGYDARCLSCSHVFFVKPDPIESGGEEVETEISAVCPHCDAVYEFTIDDIPEVGYDAQCTQCKGMFFVSPWFMQRQRGAEFVAAPVEPASSEEENKDGKSDSETGESPSKETQVKGRVSSQADVPEMLTLAMQLGESATASTPGDVSVDAVFEQRKKRRQQRLKIVGFVALGFFVLNVLSYFIFPHAFDATVGPLVGLKAAVKIEAIPFADKAKRYILADTSEDYDEALSLLGKALDIDRDFPDAIAYKALTHILKGGDLLAIGRVMNKVASEAVDEIKRLQRLSIRDRPQGYTELLAGLRRKAVDSNKESRPYLEKGGQEIARGLEFLKTGFEEYSNSRMMVLAYGIYQSVEVDAISLSRDLENALEDLEVREQDFNLTRISNPWIAYLRGLILLKDVSRLKSAISAFQRAIELEPKMNRARFQLAVAFEKSGEKEEATQGAEYILSQERGHEKAKALLKRLKDEKGRKNTDWMDEVMNEYRRKKGPR